MSKTTLNLRVDKSLKDSAEKVVDELGLTMSAAINLYLKMIVRTKGIPFDLKLVKNDPKKKTQPISEDEFEDELDSLDFDDSESIRKAIGKL